MILDRNDHGQRRLHKTEHGELVTAVSTLVNSMLHAGASDDGATRSTADAASQAVEAAVGAERRIAILAARVSELERLAVTDELTGLFNRRGFELELRRALALARRHGEPGILAYADLDGFKLVNDTYGHLAGDEVLRHVGRVLSGNVRCTDSVGRLGGDEFAVLLPRTPRQGGLKRIETLSQLLNPAVLPWEGASIAIHASIGVRVYAGDTVIDGSALMSGADAAMYRTKRLRAETGDGCFTVQRSR